MESENLRTELPRVCQRTVHLGTQVTRIRVYGIISNRRQPEATADAARARAAAHESEAVQLIRRRTERDE